MINQLKTIILLGSLTALFLFVGNLVGGYTGLIFGIFFALIMNFGSYWFSDKIVLKMYGAKKVTGHTHPNLINMVKNVAHRAKIPMPKVYIVDKATPNAFATGRSPNHSAIAVTSGIMELLNDEELEGVIAHEASHIKNRDTLIATIAATIAGVISFVATMAQWAAIFGGFRGDDEGNGLIEMLVLIIVTPIVATIIQLAISRSREYLADESAAKILHNSKGLSYALAKLEKGIHHYPMHGNSSVKSTASLFILNPFSAKGITNLFSTHPSTRERIKKLKSLKY